LQRGKYDGRLESGTAVDLLSFAIVVGPFAALFTDNEGEFRRVLRLKIENWATV